MRSLMKHQIKRSAYALVSLMSLMPLMMLAPCTGAALAADTTLPASDGNDTIFRALKDEMDRSVSRLQLKGHQKPYFMSYVVKDKDVVQISASYGALSEHEEFKDRDLNVDVRVGDYDLDNTGYSGGGFFFGGFGKGFGGNVTLDEDYDGLRHTLWLNTDSEYKQAVEDLESKKAYLKQNDVKDRPPDFSRESAVVELETPVRMQCDTKKWSDAVRDMSAVFKDYPKIDQSMVMYEQDGNNRWLLNSEGTKTFTASPEYSLMIVAAARAEDGSVVSDSDVLYGEKESDLPSTADAEKRIRALADRLTETVSAPLLEDYTGPVLFEGSAAAEFLAQTLSPNFANPVESLGSSGFSFFGGGSPLKDRLGMRILPAWVSVVDDPLATDYKGQKLYGGAIIDDEGVRPEKITLVEKGILKTFCSSRTPSRYVKKSNGHNFHGTSSVTNLFILPEQTIAKKAMYAKLRKMGKEEGLKSVLVVRRVQTPLSLILNPKANVTRRLGGGGSFSMLPTALVYKVDVETGKETVARITPFSGVGLGTMRDIVAMGNDTQAYSLFRHGSSPEYDALSIITPSILVKELDLQKAEKDSEKAPILSNPYFEKD